MPSHLPLRTIRRALAFLAIAHSCAHAATFDVTTTADYGPGTLRQAIWDANSNSGADVITFSIPGGGEQIIKLDSELPPIMDVVTIDGYTQPGATRNTRGAGFDAMVNIFVDGSAIPPSSTIFRETYGLTFRKGSDGSMLSGVKLSGFSHGVVLANVDKVTVEGSKVLDNGTAQILVSGNDNVIGLPGAPGRNLIAGGATGIHLVGERNTVKNNYIGFAESTGEKPTVNPSLDGVAAWFGLIAVHYSSAAVNGDDLICNKGKVCGLAFKSNHHQIGGLEKGEGNVIVGQALNGVVSGGSSRDERFSAVMHVDGNVFGASFDGRRDRSFGNFYGVYLNHQGASVIAVQGNSIFDGEDGIVVKFGQNPLTSATSLPVTGARLSNNRIVGHRGMAIDLGENNRDSNDSLDKDGGDNNTQNFPVLAGAPSGGGWVLDSAPSQSYTLEFFHSANCKSPEADMFLGARSVTTDPNGHATFTGSLYIPAGGFITATATDKAGNTSELSDCVATARLGSKVEIVSAKTGLLSGSWDSRFEMKVHGGGFFTPTGNIDLWFLDASGTRRHLGSTSLNGNTAVWQNYQLFLDQVPTANTPGIFRVQAEYTGDAVFDPSTSNVVDYQVFDVKHTFTDERRSDILRASFAANPPGNYEFLRAYDAAAGLTGNWKPVGLAPGKSIVAAGKFVRGFGRASYLAIDTGGNMTVETRGPLLNSSLAVRPIPNWAGGTVVEVGRFFKSHQQGIVVRTSPTTYEARLLGDAFAPHMPVVRTVPLASATAQPSTLSIVAVGDFNGDGNDDIIWKVNGRLEMQLMDGGAHLGLPTVISPPIPEVIAGIPVPWVIEVVGDFDGDGRTDILWRGDDYYYIALMFGASLKEPVSTIPVHVIPAEWKIQVVADYDGDGKADLMWRNEGSVAGTNVIHHQNGSGFPPPDRRSIEVSFLPLTTDFIDP